MNDVVNIILTTFTSQNIPGTQFRQGQFFLKIPTLIGIWAHGDQANVLNATHYYTYYFINAHHIPMLEHHICKPKKDKNKSNNYT